MDVFEPESLHMLLVHTMRLYFAHTYRLMDAVGIHPGQVPLLASLHKQNGLKMCIRDSIMAVDKGQTEAGRSLGLSGGATMLHIVIPQAVKNVLPALGNEFIVLLKETSVAGYIGIADLTKGAQSVGSITYDYMVPLLCAAFVYFLMTTVLSTGISKLERRLRRSD